MTAAGSGVRLIGVLMFSMLWAPLITPLASAQSADTLTTSAAIDALIDRVQAVLAGPDSHTAEPDIQRALAAARKGAYTAQTARALLTLGELHYGQRQWDSALPAGQEALKIYEGLDSALGVGRANDLLSRIAGGRRDPVAALAHAERAVDAFGAINEFSAIAGTVDRIVGTDGTDIERIRPLVERAVACARTLRDLDLEGTLLHDFGDRLFNAGRYRGGDGGAASRGSRV